MVPALGGVHVMVRHGYVFMQVKGTIAAKRGRVMEQIEARQFTWCSAFYPAVLDHRRFVVMTPDRSEAHERAVAFATEHWGEPASVNVYPKTYVRKAREAYALGLHD